MLSTMQQWLISVETITNLGNSIDATNWLQPANRGT